MVDEFGSVAFLCNSKREFIDFINCSTKEMHFSKGGYYHQTKDVLINDHSTMYADGDGIYALIYVSNHFDDFFEFQFYSRKYKDHNDYSDWSEYKIIDYSKLSRKKKLEKIYNGKRR